MSRLTLKSSLKTIKNWVFTAVFIVFLAGFSLINQPSAFAQTTPSQASETAPAVPAKLPVQSVRANITHLLETNECVGCNLNGAQLKDMNLQAANLERANLQEEDFEHSNLQGINLQGANLREVDLSKTNIASANLQSANLYDADLEGANLQGANLQGTDIQEAILSRQVMMQ